MKPTGIQRLAQADDRRRSDAQLIQDGRIPEERPDLLVAADRSIPHHDDMIAVFQHMLHIMCDKQDRLMEFLVHADEQLHHLFCTLRIQSGRRLIKHEHARIHRQDAGNGDASFLSAGQFKR